MPNQNLSELDQNIRRTRRAAAILAAIAAVVWGAAAVLTSENSATAVVDDSTPTSAVHSAEPSPDIPTDVTEPDESDEPTEPTEPEPQVPIGGNGDLAASPTTEPPSCAGLCVAPVDLHPLEVEIGRTPAGIGLANSEPGGCSTECITRAQVFQSDGTTDIDIEVETHTPAFIAIYVDDEEPHVTDDGRPYFPGSQPVANTHGDLDTWFTDTLTSLTEETEYWVIVRATDADVRSSYVVGSVVTPRIDDDVVVVAFASIDILYDGDHGRNKGELSFAWYAGLDQVGHNGEYKRGDGSRIDLSSQDNVGVFELTDGELPTLQMRGVENDPRGSLRFCDTAGTPLGYGTDEDCGLAWNSTVPFAPTMDDIAAMADCSVFDVGELYDGWVCTRIATVESHGGIPEFSVVVAFKAS